MSLSNEERLSGMYWAIYRLNEIKQNWESDYRLRDFEESKSYLHIQELLGKFWHTFLGKQSNSLHWLTGSSSTNSITDVPKTPWEMAVTHHLEKAAREVELSGMTEEDRKFQEGPKDPFDAKKYCDIPALLSHAPWGGVSASYAFKAYMWVEQLLYYLRRYDDSFSKSYEALSELASELLGACFSVFSSDSDFAKAYLVHQMVEILYGGTYPYGDPDIVVQILSSENLHHNFTKLMKWEMKDLAKHHIEMVQVETKAKKLADPPHKWSNNEELLKLRLYKTLEFSDSIHEFPHVQKKVINLLKDSPLASEVPSVEKELARLSEQFAANKKERSSLYSEDHHSRALHAYGPWKGFELMHDYLESQGLSGRQLREKAETPVKKASVKKASVKKASVKKASVKKASKKTVKKVRKASNANNS